MAPCPAGGSVEPGSRGTYNFGQPAEPDSEPDIAAGTGLAQPVNNILCTVRWLLTQDPDLIEEALELIDITEPDDGRFVADALISLREAQLDQDDSMEEDQLTVMESGTTFMKATRALQSWSDRSGVSWCQGLSALPNRWHHQRMFLGIVLTATWPDSMTLFSSGVCSSRLAMAHCLLCKQCGADRSTFLPDLACPTSQPG